MTLIAIPIIYSDEFLEHQTGNFHPEKPGRLIAITTALQQSAWADRLEWRSPTPVADRPNILEAIHQVHVPEYVQALQSLSAIGGGHIDGDTVASARTYDVALLAVSAWMDGVDQVLQSGQPTFIAARPPGHHALARTGMGFCIFANAAIAALYALEQPQVERVAILDWDVHHGNGTQEAIWNHPQIAFVSTHQAPFYPGTGTAQETGAYNNILNLPMKAHSTIAEYLPVFEHRVMPFLRDFNPDLLIVSAGFDANHDDPLASISLRPQDFGTFTQLCLQLTRKIVFGLEGGYDFKSLSESVVAVIDQCLSR